MVADLYIRVSTDEQAEKGYSQRNQEELLQKYCSINNITVRNVIFEDHSAKTFVRPQWKTYLLELRKNKGKTDLVLFLKWDRFSRNAGDAYQMINTLRKLGVEPQAIEQPLDLSIPENKMMLAFYLAAPEVENDRRALNVIHGMRRARKEGRYMGLAPVGYTNKTDEAGRKSIIPLEPAASIMRWAFNEIAKGIYNTEQIYKKAKKMGFKGTKSLFWFAIRNPVYCGKIFVPKYKDEASSFVKGLHEPLISEELFYDVQNVLDGRKRGQYKLKIASNLTLPLRGFLICPLCGKILTGSASKGKTKYYSYYHCFLGCKYRQRADDLNEQFERMLKQYIPRPEIKKLMKTILNKTWENQSGYIKNGKKDLLKEISNIKDKLSYSRELLVSKQIDADDYKEMKFEYGEKISKLEAKLSGLSMSEISITDLLDKGIENLLKLESLYENSGIDKKRAIISSIFPDKMNIENKTLRTLRVNEVVNYIFMIDKEVEENKKGQSGNESTLSCQVVLSVQFSNHFLEDLKKLASNNKTINI